MLFHLPVSHVAAAMIFVALAQPLARAQNAVAPQSALAIVRGRIVAADSGRPLRRAQITAVPESGSQNRGASTNADGRYEIKDLPEGRYRISVIRSGYLPLQYGQRRPLEQPKLLEVVGHGAVEDVDFSLPRMALIAGRVFDEGGDPIDVCGRPAAAALCRRRRCPDRRCRPLPIIWAGARRVLRDGQLARNMDRTRERPGRGHGFHADVLSRHQ
jgi:hypothetical protein